MWGSLGSDAARLSQRSRGHGDGHVVTIDQPLAALGNVVRVSTFGAPFVHWIRVTVDRHDPSVFAFHLQIVAKNLTN